MVVDEGEVGGALRNDDRLVERGRVRGNDDC